MNSSDQIDQESQKKFLLWKKSFYIIAGIAGIIAGVFIRKNWSAEITLLQEFGLINENLLQPTSVLEWFSMFHTYPLLGLIYLQFLDVINYILVSFIFLGLFFYFKNTKPTQAKVALLFGITAVLIVIITNPALAMMRLSNQYYNATTNSEMNTLLLKGEQLLPFALIQLTWQGMIVYFSQICFAIAGLIYSILFLKSTDFKKWVGMIGIIGHGFLLTFIIPLFFFPALLFLPYTLAAIFIMIWHIAVGFNLIKFGKKLKK
ncbi:hypothetical protein NEF87_001762 [Candidatus Lokiarchaeum ossiferum]|uniref:DUF4386 domain-containing protein n=1 Tax=Candidatus Lokiarchaeum ossiferum TaxID=2951803 RepID=A0ABY6HRH7_9ARCH|nr:hypothetical protein NEF87_001762 [Candidatus Lokiarchaeum sp. B-35]